MYHSFTREIGSVTHGTLGFTRDFWDLHLGKPDRFIVLKKPRKEKSSKPIPTIAEAMEVYTESGIKKMVQLVEEEKMGIMRLLWKRN